VHHNSGWNGVKFEAYSGLFALYASIAVIDAKSKQLHTVRAKRQSSQRAYSSLKLWKLWTMKSLGFCSYKKSRLSRFVHVVCGGWLV
jgi:hypothetical protein